MILGGVDDFDFRRRTVCVMIVVIAAEHFFIEIEPVLKRMAGGANADRAGGRRCSIF